MNFIIYNAAGEILSTGACPDEEVQAQCPPGAFIMAGDADLEADSVDVELMQVVVGGKPPPPVNMDYQAARAGAYPPVSEQLDMLWKAMDESPGKRLEPFYGLIKAIKTAYPKDNSVAPGSVIIYRTE